MTKGLPRSLARSKIIEALEESARISQQKPQIVGTRGAVLGGLADSGTTYSRGETCMRSFLGPKPVRDLQIILSNFKAPGNGPEIDGVNPVQGEAAIENSDRTAFASFNFRGQLLADLARGGIAESDVLPLALDGGGYVFLRTGVIVPVGASWPQSAFWVTGVGEAQIQNTEATSAIHGTGQLANRNGGPAGGGWLPLALIGKVSGKQPAVCLYGDSIWAGTVGDATVPSNGARGVAARAMFMDDGRVAPYVVAARHTEQAAHHASAYLGYKRRITFDYSNEVLCNFVTNDIAAGRSLVQIQTDVAYLSKLAKAAGNDFTGVACMPRTNAGNTAPSANYGPGSIREQYNAWGPTQVGRIFDRWIDFGPVTDAAGGLWKPGLMTDGVHPDTNGAPILANYLREEWTKKIFQKYG